MTSRNVKGGLLAVLAGAMMFHSIGCPLNARLLRGYLPQVLTYAALEFVTDNDAVFDLFQDDFGTGATFDDRFVPGASRVEPADAVAGTFNQ